MCARAHVRKQQQQNISVVFFQPLLAKNDKRQNRSKSCTYIHKIFMYYSCTSSSSLWTKNEEKKINIKRQRPANHIPLKNKCRGNSILVPSKRMQCRLIEANWYSFCHLATISTVYVLYMMCLAPRAFFSFARLLLRSDSWPYFFFFSRSKYHRQIHMCSEYILIYQHFVCLECDSWKTNALAA